MHACYAVFYLTLFAITILGKVQVMVHVQRVSVPKVLDGPNPRPGFCYYFLEQTNGNRFISAFMWALRAVLQPKQD